jgi:hypothetical protein
VYSSRTRTARNIFTHGGVDEGFVSQYVGSVEGGYGVVVMTNTYNTALFNEIINSVATTYHWKNFYTPVIKKEISLPVSLLQTYVGKYKWRTDTLPVILKNDGLYIDVGDGGEWKIHFTDNTHWFVLENKADLNFIIDASKTVTGFSIDKETATKLE